MNSFSLTRYLFVILAESVDSPFCMSTGKRDTSWEPYWKDRRKGETHLIIYIAQIFSLRFTCKNEKKVEPLMSQKPTYYVL